MSDSKVELTHADADMDDVANAVFVVKEGDTVLVCFHETDVAPEQAQAVRDALERFFPGVGWLFLSGVAGLIVREGDTADGA